MGSSELKAVVFICVLAISNVTPLLAKPCPCGSPKGKPGGGGGGGGSGGGYHAPGIGVPGVPLPPVGIPKLPPVGVPKLPLPPIGVPKLPLPPVGIPKLPPIGVPKLPLPPVGIPKLPPVGVPKLPLPPVGIPKLPLPPVGVPGVSLPPVIPGVGVGGTPPSTYTPSPSPPCTTPTTPPSSPPYTKASPYCPVDTLKLGACADVLGGLVHAVVGDKNVHKCCPVIAGLLELEAALCLCTTIHLKVLDLNVALPIALELLVTCGKQPPPGFKCPPQ